LIERKITTKTLIPRLHDRTNVVQMDSKYMC